MQKIIAWAQKHQLEFWLLVGVMLLATVLRFWQLEPFLHFASDEGRDAFIVRDMVLGQTFPLIGPEASIGHFHLGPFFYYLLFPFFLVSGSSPVAGAVLIALGAVATVFLLWKLVRDMFSREAAMITAFLFATSFVAVLHGRWSWNLNLLPFSVALFLFAFWKIITQKKAGGWFVLLCANIGIALQLHASAFLLLPVALIILLVFRPRSVRWYMYPVGILLIVALLTPLIVYETTHASENYAKISKVYSEQLFTKDLTETVLTNGVNFFQFFRAIVFADFAGLDTNLLFKNINAGTVSFWPTFFFLLLVVVTIPARMVQTRKTEEGRALLLLLLVTAPLALGFLFFQSLLYLHYFILFFVLVPIAVGYTLSLVFRSTMSGRILVAAAVVLLVSFNLFKTFDYWHGLTSGTWEGSYDVSYRAMEDVTTYVARTANGAPIRFICDVPGHAESFRYILVRAGLKVTDASPLIFRVYKNIGHTNRFGILEVEELRLPQ